MHEIIRRAFEGPTIFRDESKLFPDYIPFYLPHREAQLQSLARYFRVILDKPGSVSQKVIITGPVGTGKTVVSKRFGLEVEKYAADKNLKLRYVHVNCHRDRTLFLVMRRIAEVLSCPIPSRGLSSQEIMHLLRDILEHEDMYLLIALDEVDYLVRTAGGDVLYDLIRITEDEVDMKCRFNYILIMRDLSIIPALDRSITSALMHNIIRFSPYTSGQIMDILRDRVNEAFEPGVVGHETLKLISDIAGFDTGGPGDARYALELLWRAGRYAEQEGYSRVMPDHVRKAKRDIHPSLRTEVIDSLAVHEKLLLLAIVRSLRKSGRAYISLGMAEREYKLVCEEWNERPRRHTQVWEYVQSMKRSGILMTRISGPGYRGKTTLISLPDVPTEIMERYLIESLRRLKS